MILKSAVDSLMLSAGVFVLVLVFTGGNSLGQMPGLLFSPLGFLTISGTFFLEIFGNRW